MWKWLKKLGNRKKQEVLVEQKKEAVDTVVQKENCMFQEDTNLKNQVSSVQPINYRRAKDMLWLVIIDNHQRKELRAFKFEAIQNFYIVNAPDEITAKGFVWSTFGRNISLLDQIRRCTYATPLNQILETLPERGRFWSYIPIGKKRQIGQRRQLPTKELLGKGDYNEDSAQAYEFELPDVPPPSSGKVSQKEISEARAEGINIKPQAQQLPQMPANMQGMDPQQMMTAFMTMMSTFMGQQAAPITEEQLASHANTEVPNSLKLNALPPEAIRDISMAASYSPGVDVDLNEDVDLLNAINAQRAAGFIPKNGELPNDLDLGDIPDNIDEMVRGINFDRNDE